MTRSFWEIDINKKITVQSREKKTWFHFDNNFQFETIVYVESSFWISFFFLNKSNSNIMDLHLKWWLQSVKLKLKTYR